MKWVTLSPNAIKNLDYGTFMMVARPDGKSWSGTLDGSDANGVILKNGKIRTELTFARHQTASYLVIPRPKWNSSEERSVGNACVSTCIYRWSTDHKKQNKKGNIMTVTNI